MKSEKKISRINKSELWRRARMKKPSASDMPALMKWRRARIALGLAVKHKPLTPDARRKYMREYYRRYRKAKNYKKQSTLK